MALGYRILRMVHSLLSNPRPYHEEGADYYRPTDRDHLKDRLLHRLRKLDYVVEVTPATTAA